MEFGGATARILAGEAFGHTAPPTLLSRLFYIDLTLPAGKAFDRPGDDQEVGVYVVSGQVRASGRPWGASSCLVYERGDRVKLEATADARIMLFGGEPLDGPREIWWNFVSSSKARIDRAKADWASGAFGKIPGDDIEFIPLPDH